MYFDAADTILDTEVQTRLGMQSRFDEPSVGAPRVKRTGEREHDGLVSTSYTYDMQIYASGLSEVRRGALNIESAPV